jgi:hypothetical protein
MRSRGKLAITQYMSGTAWDFMLDVEAADHPDDRYTRLVQAERTVRLLFGPGRLR